MLKEVITSFDPFQVFGFGYGREELLKLRPRSKFILRALDKIFGNPYFGHIVLSGNGGRKPGRNHPANLVFLRGKPQDDSRPKREASSQKRQGRVAACQLPESGPRILCLSYAAIVPALAQVTPR